MSDRNDLLAFKRDVGTATPDELAELDTSLAAAEAKLRDSTALVGGDGGGCIAVPAATLLPSTWDYNDGGNAKALAEWEAKYRDAESPRLVLAPDPPADFKERP